MRAVWYERQGPAADVLVVGELPDPEPGPGEVRVRLSRSGVNPGDTKKRSGYFGLPMPYPTVVPHSDGAGRVDATGPGVDGSRVGERVWVHGAQSYRRYGTAAELVCVPAAQAVPLPDSVSEDLGACLGIPGITAHRCLFADGDLAGQRVLVHGVLGAVASIAAQLARAAGATVVGTVRRSADLAQVPDAWCDQVVALDADPAAEILAQGRVDRVVEVAFGANINLNTAVVAGGAIIAAYATGPGEVWLPFWDLLFANVTIRLCGSDDFPSEARCRAVRDLTEAAAAGRLTLPISEPLPLERCAEAHDRVDAGSRQRVLLAT